MRFWGSHHPPRRLLPSLLVSLICTSLLACVASAKAGPEITKTAFDNIPMSLFYFDDTDTVLFNDRDAGIVYRTTNAGIKWDPIAQVPKGVEHFLFEHPYDNHRAYLLGGALDHWATDDRGETWYQFSTEHYLSTFSAPLNFHAEDPEKIIFNAMKCDDPFMMCDEMAYHTVDGFKTTPKLLRTATRGCYFAKSSKLFSTGDPKTDGRRILCVAEGRYSNWPRDNRLLVSDDYFDTEEEPDLDNGRTVPGVVDMAIVSNYLVVAVKAEGTQEMALFVTTDAEHWHRAEFPSDHRLEEDAYTILESTNYSLQVDVMTSKTMQPIGVLFSSNSQGTFFTRLIEHTNRNRHGLVDFEKIRGIRGIVLVNIVENWEKLDLDPSGRIDKRLRSQISFDDGRTWDNLTTDKGRDLHLHSVTNLHNSGRIFSSPAPGLVMGIGNTGDYLRPYDQGDLYVSDDAGLTWWKGQEGAHKYEFGDQGSVLVAVNDEETTDEIVYSIDHGHNWIKADLGLEGEKVRARMLTTTPDSTTQKFLLVASMIAGSKSKHYIFTIDFAGLHERTCKSSDFERWNARVDKSGDPICVMGEQQFYERRRADAECFVNRDFKDPVPDTKPCDCTEEDFECDFNFERSFDGETCILNGKLDVPTGACKNPEDTFKGTSGWRKIPGNNCLPTKNDLAREIDRKCSEAGREPKGGEISSEITPFDANSFREYYYLERTKSSSGKDETVVMRTDQQQIFMTRDHGKTWKEILEDKHIQSIWPHRYVNDEAFFLTAGTTVYYTMDRGETFREFEAPAPPTLDTRVPVMNFHPNQKDWLIWIAAKDCGLGGGVCHSDAWVSKNRGVSWEPLRQFVRKCEFITQEGRGRHDEKLVYCEQYENENLEHRLQLVSSDDWFVEDVTVPFDDIVDFATMSEFIIVAARDPDQKSLKVDASIDGKTFADAQFPRDLNVPVQRAYTVLDSSTHSVFLHVTVNDMLGQEYGTIIKSNSNGSSYVTSLNYVNRNTPGYVDFEKSQVLQGVAIVNIVDNFEGMVIGETKKLKTMITHNDGAEWDLLPAPKKDADGKDFACTGDKCSLHLHGYTERNDPRDTYSSPSAVGVMMGVGNVGEYLGRYGDGDTFMTTDGGISWKWVKKGTYQWEYGDQGAVIVIVERGTPTDVVFYTLDEGDTWKEFIFTDKPMEIDDISTVPSDSSRMFLLWGHQIGHGGRKLATVNLDFSGLTDQKCQLDEDHPEEGDYYLWKPKHPKQDNHCLFGHVSQFHRKRTDRLCYNGPLFEVSHGITKPHDIAKNCSCTRQDFECDFNYAREIDGTCALVKGTDPPNHIEDCSADPNLISYYDPTGYRRIPLTTCSGGQELNVAESHPCPGKEPEYAEKHRIGGFALFCAITLPILAAAAIGYYVWSRWRTMFGQIRLGDAGSSLSGGDWTKYPVMLVAGIIAGLAVLPEVVGRLWRWATGAGRRYTRRTDFGRTRGDYEAVVREDEDVGGLLGEESDEE